MKGKKVWKEGKRIVREEGENRGNPCLQDYAAEIRTFDFRGRVFRKAIKFLKSSQRWKFYPKIQTYSNAPDFQQKFLAQGQ